MQELGEAPLPIQTGQVAQQLNEFQQRPLPGEQLINQDKELPTWQPVENRVSEIDDTDAIIVRTKDGKVIAWNSVGHKTKDFDDESIYNYRVMQQNIIDELRRRGIIDSDTHIWTLSKADKERLKDMQVDFEHLTAGKDWNEYELDEENVDAVNPRDLIPF